MSIVKYKSLLLIWRDTETSKYFHVGTLTYNGKDYIFEYTYKSNGTRKIKDAIEHGYRLLPVFQDLSKTYKSTKLFSTFYRRIPSSSRVDYKKILSDLNLSNDADQMDILRKTRGMITGDPYFFMEPLKLDENTGQLTAGFYISGMRYSKLPSDWNKLTKKGDKLIAIHNPVSYDLNAVELWTEDDLFLGYVPAIYSEAIQSLLKRNIHLTFLVNEKRPQFDAGWWVYVNFKASLTIKTSDDLSDEQFNLNDLIMLVA